MRPSAEAVGGEEEEEEEYYVNKNFVLGLRERECNC
jgi:hypothetical protein